MKTVSYKPGESGDTIAKHLRCQVAVVDSQATEVGPVDTVTTAAGRLYEFVLVLHVHMCIQDSNTGMGHNQPSKKRVDEHPNKDYHQLIINHQLKHQLAINELSIGHNQPFLPSSLLRVVIIL